MAVWHIVTEMHRILEKLFIDLEVHCGLTEVKGEHLPKCLGFSKLDSDLLCLMSYGSCSALDPFNSCSGVMVAFHVLVVRGNLARLVPDQHILLFSDALLVLPRKLADDDGVPSVYVIDLVGVGGLVSIGRHVCSDHLIHKMIKHKLVASLASELNMHLMGRCSVCQILI